MNYEGKIFEFFGHADKWNDTYKDANGKGTLERFNELIGEDIDDNIVPKVEAMVNAIYDPNNAESKFLTLIEKTLGIEIYSGDDTMRRRLIKNIIKLYQIRGTERVFDILFRWIGIDSYTLTIRDENRGFDNDLETLDSVNRTFDSALLNCASIVIELTGTAPMSPAFVQLVTSILNFNLPITVEVESITYNGITLTYSFNSSFSSAFTGGSV